MCSSYCSRADFIESPVQSEQEGASKARKRRYSNTGPKTKGSSDKAPESRTNRGSGEHVSQQIPLLRIEWSVAVSARSWIRTSDIIAVTLPAGPENIVFESPELAPGRILCPFLHAIDFILDRIERIFEFFVDEVTRRSERTSDGALDSPHQGTNCASDQVEYDLPIRIPQIHRIIQHVPVQVHIPSREADGILGQETPGGRVIIARAVEIEAGLGIELVAGVGEGIGDALKAGLDVAVA